MGMCNRPVKFGLKIRNNFGEDVRKNSGDFSDSHCSVGVGYHGRRTEKVDHHARRRRMRMTHEAWTLSAFWKKEQRERKLIGVDL